MTNTTKKRFSLKTHNTFGVAALCEDFIVIEDETQLFTLYEDGAFEKKFMVLGEGSNVLFTKDYDGLIVKMGILGITHSMEGDCIYVTAKGGEIWDDFVWYCVDHGFGGVENMALIPGTVGASPIQNIGAYGTELMDVFYCCRAFDTATGTFKLFQKKDCCFTYRDSIFKSKYKGRFIITSVTYRLPRHAKTNTSYGAINAELARRGIVSPSIKDIAEVVSHIRVEKLPHPSTIGNAGSFFKNPVITGKMFEQIQQRFPDVVFYPLEDGRVKLAAGWLIEACGWKGKTDGNVAVWKNQALVITNLGNATGAEIHTLSSKIVNDVLRKFGISLIPEVNIL